jgi:rare lipoprotein A
MPSAHEGIQRVTDQPPRGTPCASIFGLLVAALVATCPAAAQADPEDEGWTKTGRASWYGPSFAWRPTASGQPFDPDGMTAAHRTLPLGSRVRVTNLHNGRSVLVTINDRGPYRHRREIDLSYGAARAIGMVRQGIAQVLIELIES